jgi:hypothetical protein
MNAIEIVGELERAGVRVVVKGEKVRLEPMPEGELLEAAKAQRDAVVAAWRERHRGEWGRAPLWPAEVLLRENLLAETCTAAGRVKLQAVVDYVARQPREVQQWVLRRAGAYWDRFRGNWLHINDGHHAQCEWTAAADLLCAQSNCEWSDALLDRVKLVGDAYEEIVGRAAPGGTDK